MNPRGCAIHYLRLCDECSAGNVRLLRRPITIMPSGERRYDLLLPVTDYDHWICESCDWVKEALAHEDALGHSA